MDKVTRPSLRGCINKMCRDCIYDKYGRGTWRQQVEACTITSCPLHPVRPIGAKPREETDRND